MILWLVKSSGFFLNPEFEASVSWFRSRSRPEPWYLAGAGAVALARLRLQLHLKYLFNNSRKLHGTYSHLMSFLK